MEVLPNSHRAGRCSLRKLRVKSKQHRLSLIKLLGLTELFEALPCAKVLSSANKLRINANLHVRGMRFAFDVCRQQVIGRRTNSLDC